MLGCSPTKEAYMNIKEYMLKAGLTAEALAELMDCSRQQITLVRRGKKVSEKFARQIQRITKGLVTVAEVMNPTIETLPKPKPLFDEEGDKAA